MSSWKDHQHQQEAEYGRQEIIYCRYPISPQITPRQHDVLIRIMAGMSNKEIARNLDLSVSTIKIHVAGLYRKLGVNSRTGAAAAGMAMKRTEQPYAMAQPFQLPKNYAVKYQYDQERR
jgi:DNA-binding NarL/FixJ family response regulator